MHSSKPCRRQDFSPRAAVLISFLVALAGMVYELAFAHFFAAIFGGTLVQYAVTIGLFTFALGIAGLLYPRMRKERPVLPLFLHWQGMLLILVAGSALLLNLVFQAEWSRPWSYIAYLPVFAVGIFTGFELPLLLEGQAAKAKAAILSLDYTGMFCATVLFPLWLLPAAGVNLALLFAALLNGFALLAALLHGRRL